MQAHQLKAAAPRSLYFRVQLGLTEAQSNPNVYQGLTQRIHTPAGDFVAWLHYYGERDIVAEIAKVGMTWGYPHNGDRHGLHLRMSPDSIWSMCEQIALLPCPKRLRQEQVRLVNHLRKVAWEHIQTKEASAQAEVE